MSPEVRDICEHLTDTEKQKFSQISYPQGQHTIRRLVVPVLGFPIVWYFPFTTAIFLIVLLLIACFLCFDLKNILRRQSALKEDLCNTEYGKTRGYRAETLRLYSFPWI